MLADAIARILELATNWLPQAALDQMMNLLGQQEPESGGGSTGRSARSARRYFSWISLA